MLRAEKRRGILFTGVGAYFIVLMVASAQLAYTYQLAIWKNEMSKIVLDRCLNVREAIRESIVQQAVFSGEQAVNAVKGGGVSPKEKDSIRGSVKENLRSLEESIMWLYNDNARDVMVYIYGVKQGALSKYGPCYVTSDNLDSEGYGNIYVGFFGPPAYTAYVAPYKEATHPAIQYGTLIEEKGGEGDAGRKPGSMSRAIATEVGILVYWTNATGADGEFGADTAMCMFTVPRTP
jgi:hypothetical protein